MTIKNILDVILVLSFCIIVCNVAIAKEKLTIYADRSFTKCYGAKIKDIFEKKYDCTIEYIYYNGLNHLQLSLSPSSKIAIDLVVGIDYDTMGSDDFKGYFEDHGIDISNLKTGHPWIDKKLIPYQEAIIAFVYDSNKIKSKINSFEDLLKDDLNIVITDPRICPLGLGLLTWIKKVYNKEAKRYWKHLSRNILTTTQGWGESYALFLKGECDIVLSYITSPAFHRIKENKTNIKAAIFKEGHYVHYYITGMLKKSQHKELAKKYMEELIKIDNQKEMIFLDWVHPIIDLGISLPPEFLIKVTKLEGFSPKEVKQYKNTWVNEWLESF